MTKKIYIEGYIGWEVTAKNIREQLNEADGEDVNIYINSPGGYVFEGVAIFNEIKKYDGKKTAIISGIGASMASYIPLACDYVKAEDNATYMIHNAISFAGGDYRVMNKAGKILESITKVLAVQYKQKTGKKDKEIRDMMDEETYLFGKEIVDAGFADELIKSSKRDSKDKETAVLSARSFVAECFKKVEKEIPKDYYEKIAACIATLPDDKEGFEPSVENKVDTGEIKVDITSEYEANKNLILTI
jgi:ATP-dependent protease ClpP protease subunit